MALTITYDGFGIVANANDKAADSAGGAWAELGGGTITDNPDVYLYEGATPPQSIGNQYASKTGYSYFTATTPLNFNTTEAGQYIYMWINIAAAGAFDTLLNNGFSIMVGSDTSNHYMWKIAGGDDANGWTGGWKLFVVDINNLPTGVITTGTPDHTAINTFGVWIATAVSVRADTIFLSQIACAKGLKVTGTSVANGLDEVVEWCTDYINRAAGMFQKRGSTYFSVGQITIGEAGQTAATIFNSDGNNVEYEASEFWNGTAWASTIPATINNIIVDKGTSFDTTITNDNVGISGFIDNKLAFDTSNATSSSFKGGYLKYLRSIAVSSVDTFSGTVFNLNDALSLGAASFDKCTFSTSGTLTIDATTTAFSNNTISSGAGVTGLITPDIEYLTGCTFNSAGTGHAVELTSLGDGSLSWTNYLSGYATADGSTGNEAIYVNVASGNLTINVAAGYDVPYIRTAGAIVTVVVNPVTTDIKVIKISDSSVLQNARVLLLASDGTGDLAFEDTVTITSVSTTATVTHTAHGLVTDNKVHIKGVNESEYNGVFVVTVIDVNTYTYTLPSTTTSPATGTILVTGVIFNDLTSALGIVSDTRTFSLSQPIVGRVRMSSTEGSLYKTSPIVGTINKDTGLSITVQMISDE